MHVLYPASRPFQEHRLAVSHNHELYIAEYGNPAGIPVIYNHGGPGAGSKPHHAQYFDMTKFRVILFDQRGAGSSTPSFSLEDNTTPHLVADMEKIREFLGIERWVVGGGSWGTTLSLVYAIQFSERVLSLILRGVFLARAEDCIEGMYDDGTSAQFHYPAWCEFKEKTQALLLKANIAFAAENLFAKPTSIKHSVLSLYVQLLSHADAEIRNEAAATITSWQAKNSTLDTYHTTEQKYEPNVDLTKLGLVYLVDGCYLQDDFILSNAQRIAHIPTYIIHGQYDLICSPKQADELAMKLQDCTRYYPVAGHSGDEPETVDAMVEATQAIFTRLHKG